MLATYMHAENYNTLYKAVGNSSTIEYEHQAMVTRLSFSIAPCLNNRSLWFTNFTCPQIVADTYHRPVLVYTYSEFKLKTGETNKVYQPQAFIPLFELETKNRENPISLLLAKSHFYYVEFARTPKGRTKKFNKPPLNCDHERIGKAYPAKCSKDDLSCLFFIKLYLFPIFQ